MNTSNQIHDVSDTALWVATYRLEETERPEPLFKDALARVLVGSRAKEIAAQMPFPELMSWVLVIRTLAIDRLIHKAIEQGADTVINLGAGLDTRPYRMNLPEDLKWIEVDFPNMIHFKEEKLKNESPVCQLKRISADLTKPRKRKELFKQLGCDSKKAVIITEGVIPYLSTEDAEALSKDLYSIPSFQFWIQDYQQGKLSLWYPRKFRESLKLAPFKFKKSDWLDFFTGQGWKVKENILANDEAKRVNRPLPSVFPFKLMNTLIPFKIQKKYFRVSGYVMYSKT